MNILSELHLKKYESVLQFRQFLSATADKPFYQ